MALLDVDALLTPVSDDQPCGADLEYDAQFLQLEEAAKGNLCVLLHVEKGEAKPGEYIGLRIGWSVIRV